MPDKEALNRKLLMAAENNKTEEIIELLKQGVDVNYQDRYGRTPLYRACLNNKLEIAKLLIERGADINVKTLVAWTPLHGACWNNYLEIAKLLIERGSRYKLLADSDGKGDPCIELVGIII